MAKKPDTRNARRDDAPRPIIRTPAPPKPTGKRSKTDAERLDDLLKKTGKNELDELSPKLGKKHK